MQDLDRRSSQHDYHWFALNIILSNRVTPITLKSHNSGNSETLQFTDCPFLNQSICEATTSGVNTMIVLYNALGQNRTESISVPIPAVCFASLMFYLVAEFNR